jgi:5-(carboxyamino)imidazole ribonucleotide synthase
VVQKARTGGYDGRGVVLLRSARDLAKALPGDPARRKGSFFEAAVDFEKELGVMVARGLSGQVVVYPVTEMVFDPELNICTSVIAPARLDKAVELRVVTVAVAVVEALGGVGVFGVELFLTRGGEIVVNETAPRPHNSGHYTMEACRTCQFENHLRAVAGLPLGAPGFHSPAVMVNLLGQGASGRTRVEGLDEALAVPGFSLHLYGKADSRPGRKMGHFTVTAETLPLALERAQSVEQALRVSGSPA